MMTNKYTVYLQSSNSFLKKLDKNESKYQVTSTSSLSNLEPNANTNTKNDNSKFHYVKNFNQSLLAQYLKQSVVKYVIKFLKLLFLFFLFFCLSICLRLLIKVKHSIQFFFLFLSTRKA